MDPIKVDIRKKGTIVSPVVVNDNIKAAVESLKMQPIETVPINQYKVPDSPVRSPAPFPEPVSPAGIPVIVEESAEKADGGIDFKFLNDLDLEDVDLTVEGSKVPGEYKRNVKGSLVIGTLFLISLHLFLEHCNMFTWVVRFETPQTVIAAILYTISTLCIFVIFGCALIKPSFSISSSDKLLYYYSPILVAGGMDLIAITIAGSIFSPFILFTLDSMSYLTYNELAAVLTVLLNVGLYVVMTRGNDTILSDWFHPFKLNAHDTMEEVALEEVITDSSEKDSE